MANENKRNGGEQAYSEKRLRGASLVLALNYRTFCQNDSNDVTILDIQNKSMQIEGFWEVLFILLVCESCLVAR